jgi:site-specific DNA recombinase
VIPSSASDGPWFSQLLLVQFQGMIAEYERAQILERSRRGKRQRAHTGEVSAMSVLPMATVNLLAAEKAA